MNLDEAQRNKVAAWIADGAKLSDIQTRLASELGLKFTYMEVRLLVDDLKLTPKDPEPPKVAAPVADAAKPAETKSVLPAAEASAMTGKVSVSLDQLTRPGSIARSPSATARPPTGTSTRPAALAWCPNSRATNRPPQTCSNSRPRCKASWREWGFKKT